MAGAQKWPLAGCSVTVICGQYNSFQSGLRWGPWVMSWSWKSPMSCSFSVVDSAFSSSQPFFPILAFSPTTLFPRPPPALNQLTPTCMEIGYLGSPLKSLVLLHRDRDIDLGLAWRFIEKLVKRAKGVNLYRGFPFVIESTPFAQSQFFNSWSEGIISNIFDESKNFLLLDSKLVPGAEGAPIFTRGNKDRVCIGLVLNLVIGRQYDCLSFSLGFALQALDRHLHSRLTLPPALPDRTTRSASLRFKKGCAFPDSQLVAHVDSSIVLVRHNNAWGTGCVLDEKGYILTCAHNVKFGSLEGCKITVHFYGQVFDAHLVFSTSERSVYDLAVIRVLNLPSNIRPFKLSPTIPKQGDIIYSLSHCLFNETMPPFTPSITTGVVSKPYSSNDMLHTTCVLHKGSSGGAVIRENGELIGIIAFHIELGHCLLFPFMSISVPVLSILPTLRTFRKTHDQRVLRHLEKIDDAMKERCFMNVSVTDVVAVETSLSPQASSSWPLLYGREPQDELKSE